MDNNLEEIKIQLARLEERFNTVDDKLDELNNSLKCVKNASSYDALCKTFVTIKEFNPVQKIAYGFVFLVLTGVVGGLLKLILLK